MFNFILTKLHVTFESIVNVINFTDIGIYELLDHLWI